MKIYKMDADASGPKAGTIRGFVDGVTLIGNTANLVIGGLMDGFSGLTAYNAVYAASTAGTVTQTRPSPSVGGSQIMVAELGFAVANDTVFVRPRAIQYQKRNSMVLDDTLTIQHHSDENGYRRDIWAYITEAVAGAVIDSYASANQDANVSLSNQSVATYGTDQCSGGTALGNMTDSGGLAGAFDNSAATAAQKLSSTTGQIGYDFGSGVTKAIRQYTMQHSSSLATTQAPKDWTFQYSSDNSNWTTVDTQTNQTGWSASEKRTFQFTSAISARYWRINISANNGATNVSVAEVEMMEASTYTTGPSKLAQTFTLSTTQTIASLGLWLKKVGSPTGTVTVRIETTSAGTPTGTLADANAAATFSESVLGTSYAEQAVTFSTSFSLVAGTYAIVISTSRSASEFNYIQWGADASSPGASGGAMYSYSGSWSAESKDAVYYIYTTGTSHPSRVSVNWWSASSADMVNRYGDGSGADLSTKTTFKCARSGGFTDITVVVELP
jgi:hypothetical protein